MKNEEITLSKILFIFVQLFITIVNNANYVFVNAFVTSC